jgi:hypothetical protein
MVSKKVKDNIALIGILIVILMALIMILKVLGFI